MVLTLSVEPDFPIHEAKRMAIEGCCIELHGLDGSEEELTDALLYLKEMEFAQ